MRHFVYLLCFLIILLTSCHQAPKDAPVVIKPDFKKVLGISYTEVRRTFKNGTIFNKLGLQLVPEWKVTFLPKDSVYIYSPKQNRYFNAPVQFDHDSIYNIAWAWFKIFKITKDSLRFQVLYVENKVIIPERSNMFMTLYADSYIKNVLHTTAQKLQLPRKADTLFVKQKSKLAKTDTSNAFAATTPAVIKSISPLVKVEKVPAPDDPLDDVNPSNDYIQPEYNITISKAYADFNFTFTVFIDDEGKLMFRKSGEAAMEADMDAQNTRVMKGIVNGYLKHYIAVSPGSTLGIKHSSIVILNVTGKQ